MLALDSITLADFLPTLQQDYELFTGTGGITLTLVAAEPRGPGHAQRAEPFALTFRGAPVLRLPQGIYRLQNITLGAMEIFLVQVEGQPDGSCFEATFN